MAKRSGEDAGQSEVVPAPLPVPARPSAGESVGDLAETAIDRFGPVGVYLVTGGLGVASALSAGTIHVAWLIATVVTGALGVVYNKSEASNYKRMKRERDEAVEALGQAELSEKAAIRHEGSTRSTALELAVEELADQLGCGPRDRVTLFRVLPGDPPQLVTVERFARNPSFRTREEFQLFRADEGFIGKALTDGHVLCCDLPDPTDADAYQAAHARHGLIGRTAEELSMKSRSYFGFAVEAPSLRHDFVGVVMFESLDADRWADQGNQVVTLQERAKVSLGYLIMDPEPRPDEPGDDAKGVYP